MNILPSTAEYESPLPRRPAASATPVSPRFMPRVVRAIAMLTAAVLAHAWLLPASRGQRPWVASLAPGVPALSRASHASEAGLTPLPLVAEPAEIHVRHDVLIAPVQHDRHPPRGGELMAVGTTGSLPVPVVEHGVSSIGDSVETAHAAALLAPPHGSALPVATPAPATGSVAAALALQTTPIAALPFARDRPLSPLTLPAAPAAGIATDAAMIQKRQEAIVLRIVEEYTRAFERLDVQAAKAVWPSVDVRALRQAFERLNGQQVRFASCDASIAGTNANARCRGNATFRPKVGSRVLHVTDREWNFSLSRSGDSWQIVDARIH